jgi:hypothetical protein
MSTNETGGPAFPAQFFDERATGMTLRDYFAAKAMASMCNETWPDKSDQVEICRRAYRMADSMLEARKC